MGNFIDITGNRYGRLVVLRRNFERGTGKNITYWDCVCDCGNYSTVSKPNLTTNTKSCGCLSIEKLKGNKYGEKHGESRTRLYHIWQSMKQRCYDEKVAEYKHYGARGIIICNEWLKYENFSKWAKANGYEQNLSIDRIDVNGNYCPDNCKWSTIKEQNRNKTNTVFLTLNGETKSMGEWSELLKIPMSTMVNRRLKGKTVEEILNTNYKTEMKLNE